MADESRWNDERDREWRERYRREEEARRAGGRGERPYGAGDFEQVRSGSYNDVRKDDAGRWPDYRPGHDSPAWRDRSAQPAWDARGDAPQAPRQTTDEAPHDFSGWSAPFGGKPIGQHEHGPWDRLMQESRSFFDRTREEIASLIGQVDRVGGSRDQDRDRDRDREPAAGDYRGLGPRNYRRSDERIQDDVADRLTEDARLDASRIEVSVANSEVTLTGQVRARADKRRAEDLAERVSGVRHVQNNLRADDADDRTEERTPPRTW